MHTVLRENAIHLHKLLRINYTTYDVRRDQDVVHVDTPQCNVMLLNTRYTADTWSSEHPYIYGRVLGVFHANVSYAGPLPDGAQRPEYQRIDFVWVRWYQFIGSAGEFALDSVSPSPLSSGDALDFVNPADIIRCVHLIPRFSSGKENGTRTYSRFVAHDDLWKEYFINRCVTNAYRLLSLPPSQPDFFVRFADRDMFMRYQYGMSVGHAYMHQGAFPPPHVPSIPPDFDHCEDLRSTAQPAPLVPTTLHGNARQTEENSQHQLEGCERGGSQDANSITPRVENTADPTPEGHDHDTTLSVVEDGEDGDGDGEEEEEEMDYLEDLEDGEFLAYSDMYCEEEDSL